MEDVSFGKHGIADVLESDRLELFARAATAGSSFGSSSVDPASMDCVTTHPRNFGRE